MGQVALEGMEFFAFHGFSDEEQKIGNRYGVDISIETDLKAAAISDNLHDTVNYVTLYQLVQQEMATPARLLEHVGHRIMERVFQEFPFVELAKVSVSKFNPPLGGICYKSKVTLERKRN
ncbi:dihydroneopterin aldolase [Rufibacter sp. DG15C]|uniref:dihydroneopterin aldolase n=1 Tax=Rufibacter sp. DG15C TaxID=1379909 RepID=UPI00078B4C56|nr:dihydroneopterin aldolase [Rufibacter sp. DG15C]AMM51496.1 dihydroneopterin aldolase [Rufibacter sp. DG15C]